MMELDLFLTLDDVVVCNHDENLLRMTGVDVDIKDVNFADLPPLLKSIEYDWGRGKGAYT